MKILAHLIVSAIAVGIAAWLLPNVDVTPLAAVVVVVVLAILNLFIKPIIVLLTLPLNILTLGLFTLVINALLVLLAAHIVPGFVVVGFWPALWFSVLLWLINSVFGLKKD